jgi:hypothetical protein
MGQPGHLLLLLLAAAAAAWALRVAVLVLCSLLVPRIPG